MTLTQTFAAEAQTLQPQLVAWRRDFHMHPEIGFTEVRTAGIVADHLRKLGLEVSTGIGKTGVVAVVEGDHLSPAAPVVMLRFDMDALPIQEQTGLPFSSQQAGLMHACGHDGHTAIGMGVAELLVKHRNELAGRVKLVFQPAEEALGGARAMVADGVMENPKPVAAFALHLWNRLPLNQVVVQPGPIFAHSGFFELVIHGKGGHGAMPHDTVDATVIGAQIVVAWQTIVARNVDPVQTAVLTVGTFHSGDTSNVIAHSAKLSGTIRSFDPQVDRQLRQRMQELAQAICTGFGATCDLRFYNDVPATISSVEGAALMREVALEVVGPEQVTQITPVMVGEDVSEFLNRAPGCFILVGAAHANRPEVGPHHNPTFDFDETMLATGAALLSSAAAAYLARQA